MRESALDPSRNRPDYGKRNKLKRPSPHTFLLGTNKNKNRQRKASVIALSLASRGGKSARSLYDCPSCVFRLLACQATFHYMLPHGHVARPGPVDLFQRKIQISPWRVGECFQAALAATETAPRAHPSLLCILAFADHARQGIHVIPRHTHRSVGLKAVEVNRGELRGSEDGSWGRRGEIVEWESRS